MSPLSKPITSLIFDSGLFSNIFLFSQMTRTEEVFSFTFFPEWSEIRTEKNETYVIPPDMRFNEGHKLALAVYSLLMLISGVGNVWVLVRLAKSRRSRTNRMLTHLAIADLFVSIKNLFGKVKPSVD